MAKKCEGHFSDKNINISIQINSECVKYKYITIER